MRIRSLQRSIIVFFLVYVVLAVYPGALLIRGPRPFILGLPFPLVAVSGLIIAGFIALVLLDRAYRAAEVAAAPRDD